MRPSFHFAKKLLGRDNQAVVVEVGVCLGYNALATLSEWDVHLVGVELEGSLQERIRDLLKFFPQYSLIIADSVEASKLFPDNSLDLVYIDDNHEGDGPVRSINAWYEKVRPGGVLGGHDYFPSEETEEDVHKAVNEFVRKHDLVLHCDEWDFWVVKPPRGLSGNGE